MPVVRYAIGGDNVVTIKGADGAVVPLSVQYSPEYLDTLEKIRNAPLAAPGGVSITLGEVADVAVKNMPDMIRNDNGTLAGYRLRLSQPRRHGDGLCGRRAGVSAREARAAERLLRSSGPATIRTR